MLLKHIPTVFGIDKAKELAADLNADEEDTWSYHVEKGIHGTGAALVKVKDEEGVVVGAL